MELSVLKKWAIFLSVLMLSGCTEDISIPIPAGEEQIVVEGYIEQGLPPIVLLTRSQPYFSNVNASTLFGSFVRGAAVRVSDGTNVYTLDEYSTKGLPDPVIDLLSQFYGLDFRTLRDSLDIELFAYSNFLFTGELGKSYFLEIEVEAKRITALTTIPQLNPVDSLILTPHPVQPDFDSLFSLSVLYSDPPGVRNYVRYFTKRNSEPFYPGYFNSVFDDRTLFNVDGKTFEFPIERGYNKNQNVDAGTYIYFVRGDTVTLRWSAIDEAHHGFWASLEFDQASVGNPFASPIVIRSNINGGLGVWGGYASHYTTVVVPQ